MVRGTRSGMMRSNFVPYGLKAGHDVVSMDFYISLKHWIFYRNVDKHSPSTPIKQLYRKGIVTPSLDSLPKLKSTGTGEVNTLFMRELRSLRPWWTLAQVVITVVALVFLAAAILSLSLSSFSNALLLCALSIILGAFIFRLFVAGHEASHGLAHENFSLNRLLGELCVSVGVFWPFEAWRISHHHHHAWVGHEERENSWRPWRQSQYLSYGKVRRALYLGSRSVLFFIASAGFMVCTIVDCLRGRRYPAAKRKRASVWFSTAVAALALGAALMLPILLDQPTHILFLLIIPQAVFHLLLSTVTLLHHTAPENPSPSSPWSRTKESLERTYWVSFGPVLDAFFLNITCHPAHHLDQAIPYYHLHAAHQELERREPRVRCLRRRFTLPYLGKILRECRLQDDAGTRWLGRLSHVD